MSDHASRNTLWPYSAFILLIVSAELTALKRLPSQPCRLKPVRCSAKIGLCCHAIDVIATCEHQGTCMFYHIHN